MRVYVCACMLSLPRINSGATGTCSSPHIGFLFPQKLVYLLANVMLKADNIPALRAYQGECSPRLSISKCRFPRIYNR